MQYWLKVAGTGKEPITNPDWRELRGAEVPVVHARSRCLIDHLERLQEILANAGFGAAGIEVEDETLLAMEGGG